MADTAMHSGVGKIQSDIRRSHNHALTRRLYRRDETAVRLHGAAGRLTNGGAFSGLVRQNLSTCSTPFALIDNLAQELIARPSNTLVGTHLPMPSTNCSQCVRATQDCNYRLSPSTVRSR